MTDADLVFLPWVRRGASAALLSADTFGPDQPGMSTATASVTVNGRQAPVLVTVMGPAHVKGLDRRQVVRTDPAAGSRTFEPNFFPLVELDEPSLPWLFTPAGANAQARLRPWLVLAVVKLRDGVRLDPPGTGPLPVLRVANPAEELPDLDDSWAWAHGQVTSEVGVSVDQQLAGNPERTVARLLCSRVLEPDADYLGCVVPAFELGRLAGLGEDTADEEGKLRPAWKQTADPVDLPVYYSWPFATGAGGDFQSLAMLLTARPLPDGIGFQPIDLGESGLQTEIPAGTTIQLGGALRPVGAADASWPTPALRTTWETDLKPVLNAAAQMTAEEDPLLAPPLYGAAQAGLVQLDESRPGRWFEQLNLMPPHRAVVNLGTRVVQVQQEALMASAWEQAAELARVNQLLRQTQLGWRVATSLHTRHIVPMDAAVGLQVLAPAQARMLRTNLTLASRLAETGLVTASYDTALRRVARPRGGVNRRVQRVAPTLPRMTSVLLQLQPLKVLSRRVAPTTGPVTLERVASGVIADVSWAEATGAAVAAAPKRPFFAFVPMGQPVPIRADGPGRPERPGRPPVPPVRPRLRDLPILRDLPGLRGRARQPRDRDLPIDPLDPVRDSVLDPVDPFPRPPRKVDSADAGVFRTLAQAHLARFVPERAVHTVPALRDGPLKEAFDEAVARTLPTETFASRVRAVFTLPDAPATDEGVLSEVGLSPMFPQPMVEPLVEVAQELVLPGLDLVPPNTIVPLETNSDFVEAYLVGLNTEMGRELLWRGYPADLRATYFNRFWDAASSPGRPPDIASIRDWGDRALGAAGNDENFVMLVRSELLRRYPDAIVYATKAAEERHPIFTGGFEPDVRYFGFEIGVDGIGDWSIVIQEHPSAPRFGVEVDTDTGTATHGPPPGADAAITARLTRQLPVRITIPTSVLGLV